MAEDLKKRSIRQAIRRGFMRKCPNCGKGALFKGYLKVNDTCPVCSESYIHQRADDGPAWATMLITGHLLPPVVMAVYDYFENPNPFLVGLGLAIMFTLLTLILLPRIKGVFIAIQWANYMYGFDPKFAQTKDHTSS